EKVLDLRFRSFRLLPAVPESRAGMMPAVSPNRGEAKPLAAAADQAVFIQSGAVELRPSDGTLRRKRRQWMQNSLVPDGMINPVFEPGPPLLEFFDFLVGREIDLLFDAVDGFVQGVIFLKVFPEAHVAGLEQLDGVAIFREFF